MSPAEDHARIILLEGSAPLQRVAVQPAENVGDAALAQHSPGVVADGLTPRLIRRCVGRRIGVGRWCWWHCITHRLIALSFGSQDSSLAIVAHDDATSTKTKTGQRIFPHPVRARKRESYVCDVTQWLPPLVVELLLQIGCTA